MIVTNVSAHRVFTGWSCTHTYTNSIRHPLVSGSYESWSPVPFGFCQSHNSELFSPVVVCMSIPSVCEKDTWKRSEERRGVYEARIRSEAVQYLGSVPRLISVMRCQRSLSPLPLTPASLDEPGDPLDRFSLRPPDLPSHCFISPFLREPSHRFALWPCKRQYVDWGVERILIVHCRSLSLILVVDGLSSRSGLTPLSPSFEVFPIQSLVASWPRKDVVHRMGALMKSQH